MFITHPKHWVLGTAIAATVAFFASIAAAESSFTDAFEPDLDAWEELPVH
jgi:hypothetical protein